MTFSLGPKWSDDLKSEPPLKQTRCDIKPRHTTPRGSQPQLRLIKEEVAAVGKASHFSTLASNTTTSYGFQTTSKTLAWTANFSFRVCLFRLLVFLFVGGLA